MKNFVLYVVIGIKSTESMMTYFGIRYITTGLFWAATESPIAPPAIWGRTYG
jgi:hypothetical protein